MVRLVVILLGLVGVSSYIFFGGIQMFRINTMALLSNDSSNIEVTPPFLNLFREDFNSEMVLEETGNMGESRNPYWWVNSGGQLILREGLGKTIQGDLPAKSKWQIKYFEYNPGSTDNGVHPQNIFRLVTKSTWLNFRQQVYFRIKKYYPSENVHRQESNGVLLFNRYLDGDNLYYAGLRVDGAAVIKKKVGGSYFTLRYTKALAGEYDRRKHPNLLPVEQWIGLRTEVINKPSGEVWVTLFVNWDKSGGWEQVAQVVDDGMSYGGSAIKKMGHGGIRSDFMDVEFDDYLIEEIHVGN